MRDSEELQSFDFYLELSKSEIYDYLVPDRTSALVLALLYQRERTEREGELSRTLVFSEEDIRNCLRQVEPTNDREQHERCNQFIRNMQAHFLWRDEEKGTYRFKEYARDFCRLMYDRLEQNFEPTRTKYIFSRLTKSLDEVYQQINDNPKAFNLWVDNEFTHTRTDISNQVEVLYNKVEEIAQQIREVVKPESFELLNVLRAAERKVDLLIGNADELDHIFRASTTIRMRLNDLQHRPYAEVFGNRVTEVLMFLSDADDQLNLVRRRIKRIKPHIQRLFNVQQRQFDLNTGKFLMYLLEHSQVEYKAGSKQLLFPTEIEEKRIYRESLNFTRLSKQTFLPAKPIQVKRPSISKETREEQVRAHERVLGREGAAKAWLEQIRQTLETEDEVAFADVYYEILASQEDGIAVALEVARRIINDYTVAHGYSVKVGNATWRSSHPHHTLCSLTICRQTPLPS